MTMLYSTDYNVGDMLDFQGQQCFIREILINITRPEGIKTTYLIDFPHKGIAIVEPEGMAAFTLLKSAD